MFFLCFYCSYSRVHAFFYCSVVTVHTGLLCAFIMNEWIISHESSQAIRNALIMSPLTSVFLVCQTAYSTLRSRTDLATWTVSVGFKQPVVNSITTRSSAIAEGPRGASCQLKSCQLPRNSAETIIRQVLTKSMVWSWRFSRRQCVIDVHSTMTPSSRLPLCQVS